MSEIILILLILNFIHGIGGNKENWYQNMEVLSKNFNVVALDLRGYGESEDFLGPLNFTDVADDIQKLILYLGEKKCHVVGLSMGAQIALYFYKKYRYRSWFLDSLNLYFVSKKKVIHLLYSHHL